jgi:Zn ribbon nucleic-acid-binding protein
MKIRYKTAKCEIEVDGDDTKACFDEIAGAIEVFGTATCGACDSTNTMPVVRENKGVQFREMKCIDCGCSLGFGQRKSDGALFPKRTRDGQYLPHGGWQKWQPKESSNAAFDDAF